MLRKLIYASLSIAIVGVTIWGLITYNSLLQTQSDLSLLRAQVAALEISLNETEDRLLRTEENLASANVTIDSLESQIQLYKDTWGSVFTIDLRPDPDLYIGTWMMGYLVNNESATDPTWAELLDFLVEDKTDERTYRSSIYDCGSFARDVHNNAERAGIRAAYVYIYLPTTRHAFNAFKTTDRGLVFIDCVGSQEPEPGQSYDKIIEVQLGGSYSRRFLFPEGDWITQPKWEPVRELMICW